MLNRSKALKKVAGVYKVNVADITKKSRKPTFVLARQTVAFYLHKLKGMSLNEVGRLINRCHATVFHGCRKIQDDLDYMKLTGKVPERLKPYWNELEKLINNGN